MQPSSLKHFIFIKKNYTEIKKRTRYYIKNWNFYQCTVKMLALTIFLSLDANQAGVCLIMLEMNSWIFF